MSGKADLRGLPEIRFKSKFSDILETLDVGGMLLIETRRDDFGISLDLFYARNSSSGRVGPGLPAEGKGKTFSALLLAESRVRENDREAIDVLGGIRLSDVNMDAKATVAPGVTLSRSASLQWVDFQLGAKGTWRSGDKWTTSARGLLGLGSKVTYDLQADFGYRLSEKSDLHFGYRYLTLARNGAKLQADVSLQGPFVGVQFRF